MTYKQIIIQDLFVVKIIRIMNKFKILINIDETLFLRATKITHTWSEKGKEWVLNNIWCSNTFTFITAIWLTDTVYASNLFKNVKGENFVNFLNGLKMFIEERLKFRIWEWLIIMDNAPTHHSKLLKILSKIRRFMLH